jgi:hypothetical protein
VESPDFGAHNPIEIEDAHTLLLKPLQYTPNDTTFCDDDGTHRIVDKWWGYLGRERARWIALDMTLKLHTNTTDALNVQNLSTFCFTLLENVS